LLHFEGVIAATINPQSIKKGNNKAGIDRELCPLQLLTSAQ
jgi:hypothetical protein